MRFFRSCVLFVAATASLMAGGSLAVSGAVPAGASPAGITVNCPADNLQDAIYAAAAGSTLLVDGTCTGNFYINKDLTLSRPRDSRRWRRSDTSTGRRSTSWLEPWS